METKRNLKKVAINIEYQECLDRMKKHPNNHWQFANDQIKKFTLGDNELYVNHYVWSRLFDDGYFTVINK